MSAAPAAMSVRKAAGWALLSQYTSFALQFATSVVLARWFITPAELGEFTIAFAAVTLLAFLQDFGITRYIAGEKDLTPDKVQTAFTLSALFAGSIALACVALAWPIAWFYGDPALLPVTLVIAASYLCIPLAIVPQALCQRRMDYKSNAMIEMSSALANAAVAVLLAVRGHGAMALAWGAFAQQAARLIVSQWRAGGMLPWPLRWHGAEPMLAIGKAHLVQVFCATLGARAPELVIGRGIGAGAVGLFARASGLALQLRQLLAGAVTGVFYPAFRQVRDAGDPLGPPYLRVVAAYTGITWPAMAGIAVLAHPLVDLLYGPKWLAAAPLLAWVALAQVCFVALPLHADLPILLGEMRGMVRRLLGETIASLLLLVIAAPFGILWIAVSRFAHGLVWLALNAPFVRRLVGCTWGELGAVFARSGLATLAAVAPILAAYAWWKPAAEFGFPDILAGAGAGVVLWLASLFALRHPLADEVRMVLGALAARLRARPEPDPAR